MESINALTKNCTGCGSCTVSCPKQCITMESDGEGFRYPLIDEKECIHCRRCEIVCPVLNRLKDSVETQCFAAQNTDENIRAKSSSGGVFSALANYVFKENGLVCGAAYDEQFAVVHCFVHNEHELEGVRGAKYSQSIAENCFPQIKDSLELGKIVLFVGTPCQVAGLKNYLGTDYPHLILVDIICHGVPSPKVWEKYLADRIKKDARNSRLSFVNLRNKNSGWSRYTYSVEIKYEDNRSYLAPQGMDPFMRGFTQNLYLRPSCSSCFFKGIERCSDFTLGDYWGVWEQCPDFDDNKGTSLVMVHTEKGLRLWERIREELRVLDLEGIDCLANNPSALMSSDEHKNRSRFFEKMDNVSDFSAHIEKCLTYERVSVLQRIKNWMTD